VAGAGRLLELMGSTHVWYILVYARLDQGICIGFPCNPPQLPQRCPGPGHVLLLSMQTPQLPKRCPGVGQGRADPLRLYPGLAASAIPYGARRLPPHVLSCFPYPTSPAAFPHVSPSQPAPSLIPALTLSPEDEDRSSKHPPRPQ